MKKRIFSVAFVLVLALFLQIACKNDMKTEATEQKEPVLVQQGEENTPLETKIEIREENKNVTFYEPELFPDVEPEPEEVNPYLQIPLKLTEDEQELLLGLAMAEAEGEDAKGKALVMRVALNRAITSNKGLRSVIYQPKQFAVDRMTIKPSEGAYEALSMVIDGLDESQGALYFHAGDYSKYGTPLFQYGNHYFSK